MGRKRTIEITVETERIIEIRFRGAVRQADDDTDETDDGGSIRARPPSPGYPLLAPLADEPAPDAADE